MKRSLVWVKDHGAELATVTIADGRLEARGTAVGADPLPYRLDYSLTTYERYLTQLLQVTVCGEDPDQGTWSRRLELGHDGHGNWTVNVDQTGLVELPDAGADAATLTGALDCDLGLSPVTNTMPVLRDDFLHGGSEPRLHLMAWVSVPDLTVIVDHQTYSFRRVQGDQRVINYACGDWTRDISFDSDGLVIDYPDIARRA